MRGYRWMKGAGVFTLILIMGIQVGCGYAKEVDSLRSVRVYEVEYQQNAEGNAFSGNIVPKEIANVSFKVSGVVEAINVKEGDHVKKGQVIALLKNKDYALGVNAASAQLESAQITIQKDLPSKIKQAKAQWQLTKATYDRVNALYLSGAASKAEYDEISAKLTVDEQMMTQAKDAYEVAMASVRQLEASQSLAMEDLNATVLRSPMDGTVLKKVSSEGETLSAGYPIALIGTDAPLWVEFGVTDQGVGSIEIGQDVSVKTYSSQETYTGKIEEIGSLADAETKLFSVRGSLSEAAENLKPGMVARITMNSQDKMITIPFISVVHLTKGDHVYAYDESSHTVKLTPIRTGQLIDDQIVVLEGLDVGQKIVVQGQYQVQDGEKVVLHD